MKCKQCGAEIKEGAKFCQACGAKQEPPEPQRFCMACGAPLKGGTAFCTSCGAAVGAGAWPNPQQQTPQTPPPAAPAKRKNLVPVILAVLLALVLIGGISAGLAFTLFARPGDSTTAESKTDVPVRETDPVREAGAEQIDSSDADLVADGAVSLKGTVKISTDNRLFLEWEAPMDILLKEDGAFVRLSEVRSAYLENDGVDAALWGELPLSQQVQVTGELELDGSQLILHADKMTDPSGSAIVVQAEPAASEEILPESDDRLLTEQDLNGLTLQQINYAKNEIYARHGRRFDSKELQSYFDAQSWYRGTVAPANFTESVLSDVEKKNAAFLADIEFGIAPNGYQLDQ